MKARNFAYFIIVLGIFSAGSVFGPTLIDSLNSHIASVAEADKGNDKKDSKKDKDKKNNNKKDNKKEKAQQEEKKETPKAEPTVPDNNEGDNKEEENNDQNNENENENNKDEEKEDEPQVVVEPQQPQIIENNNVLENYSENTQTVIVEREEAQVEEEVVYVTEEGSPVYETPEVVETPETGAGLLSFLTLIPGSIAGYIVRKRTKLS